ncbi:MAG: ATP-binding cassette domain-containing protein [Burkholderiales bacterium]|nr:ATP-binding cassette domain-containing protein [Burkholderiales bacterium]MBI3729965.1 ATP-binding cassette domain-containing protein [Burkholderiales bacterium]
MTTTSNQKNTILQATELTFHYPGQSLFSNWSYDISAGMTLVLGGDGRGKTSLLQLLAGDLLAQSGQLQIENVSLHAQPDAYRSQVFWVDPRTDTFDQMPVPEYFSTVRKAYPGFDDAILAQAIEGLGLTPHINKQIFMLSTGSKRKVWLAAAFAAGAKVSLLDDPFAALDKSSIEFITAMLNQFAADASRAWVLAMYVTPQGFPLSGVVGLGD